jgi:hypothetical protein
MRRRKRHLSKNKQIKQLNGHVKAMICKLQEFSKLALREQRKNDSLQEQVSKLNAELFNNAKNAALIRELIAKATHVDFFRVPGNRETYRCQVDFDGQFMGLLHSRSEQEFVADDVAERIRREIITSKFINTANNNRRRELDEEMKLRSQMGRPF